MCKTVWRTVAVCLLLTAGLSAGRADEAAEARAILDRAITAMGGADKLAALPAVTWKGKGTIQAENQKIELTDELSAQADRQLRWQFEATIDGRTIPALLVVNKDKVWVSTNNQKAQELPKEISAILGADLYAVRLTGRLVALKDRAYQLSPLGELQINDRAAVGIKVTHRGRPDVDLFFDKENGLPVRSEVRVKEPEGQEVAHAFYYSAYKEVNGVKHFTRARLRRDDKLTIDLELTEVQLHEKLDDSLFDKP